ncbi:hypothetical protein [Flavobacterium sp.]|uniref:hypothetical protein n=1 Tax=Flavobacterium sp. TaxID=239 RepID=UPI0024896BC0|nr:hypothetical protein [Flavobacterium sp.]MDI1315762.1 hypothetical protein [Flavobacterium sp.]
MKSILTKNRIKRTDDKEKNDAQIQRELDNYGVKLIKIIGVVGVVIGVAILAFFWSFLINKLFKL